MASSAKSILPEVLLALINIEKLHHVYTCSQSSEDLPQYKYKYIYVYIQRERYKARCRTIISQASTYDFHDYADFCTRLRSVSALDVAPMQKCIFAPCVLKNWQERYKPCHCSCNCPPSLCVHVAVEVLHILCKGCRAVTRKTRFQ